MSVDAGLYIYLEKFRASDIVKSYIESGLDIYDDNRINKLLISLTENGYKISGYKYIEGI
ncbi:MAG: hypothetical protein IJ446_07320 [Oscillospiraceae bacterium]|nr:hypothetical protein [Oscillospiraceae bacterium]